MTPPFDWYRLYHDAANALPWASPEAIKKLTIPQLVCIGNERPPTAGKGARSMHEYQQEMERRAEIERAWAAGK